MSAEIDPNELVPGTTFGRYAIQRRIGTGGMGSVYEATHLDLKKRVALKVLHAQAAANPEVQARFLREGEAASRIHHPHVVNVTDFGVHEGVPYLVMEYLEGESLYDRVVRDGALTVAQSVDLLLPVLAAVGAGHEVGVIHRDLKPENIFLARTKRGEPEAKVVDFGISKVSDLMVSLTGADAVFGSPHYMPPEQMAASKNVDPRSDQYALGVILYECLAAHPPFEAEVVSDLMRLVMRGDFLAPSVHRPDLPPAVDRAIIRAMSKAPVDRFPSVFSFGRELLPFASERTQLLWRETFETNAQADDARVAASTKVTVPVSDPAPAATPAPAAPVAPQQPPAVSTLSLPEEDPEGVPHLGLWMGLAVAALALVVVAWRVLG